MGVMPFGMRLIILWAVGNSTIYRNPNSSYDYRENRSRISEGWKENRSTGEDHGTGYQGYAGAKGNDLRNGNFQRNGTGRKDTNHQNSDLALYLPTNGIKVGGILKTVFGGILLEHLELLQW